MIHLYLIKTYFFNHYVYRILVVYARRIGLRHKYSKYKICPKTTVLTVKGNC